MDGIAEDGGELDPTNVSREARIRSAYMDWCKEYKKEADEDRFATFSENFLIMEKMSQDSGREVVLNEYADCTEEEYIALTSAKTDPEEPEASEKPAPEPVVKTEEPEALQKPAPEPVVEETREERIVRENEERIKAFEERTTKERALRQAEFEARRLVIEQEKLEIAKNVAYHTFHLHGSVGTARSSNGHGLSSHAAKASTGRCGVGIDASYSEENAGGVGDLDHFENSFWM